MNNPLVSRSHLYILAFLGFSGIAIGALGAHALEDLLDEDKLSSLETAVRYQLLHTLALFSIALSTHYQKLFWTRRLFVTGILLFSFSIYGLLLFPLIGIPARWLGPVTPIGGLLLMGGWVAILALCAKSSKD